ncbi:VOC family protein [Phytoactinopolyspora limicola]|uniref:VOC family protein n=1 Tax=Phytoactinopolyspora limicola TaxID=2715536 RepID=UPI00140CC4A3|nr:VOC family protein [Phytoactinopolyspora limicola]
MTTKVNPIPDGYHSLTPFIVCVDAAGAIDFYQTVFGAEVLSRNDGPDGSVLHAELRIGNSMLQLSDPNPEYGLVPPEPGVASSSLMLYCDDVDVVFARAVEAGATVRVAVQTFVTGDRFGSVIDPHGRRWAIMTRVEDVPEDEAKRRVDEWVASNTS